MSHSAIVTGSRPQRETARPTIVRTGSELRALIAAAREQGQKIGLVPTMGALHEGHLALVDASQAACDQTVVTVFVNPTQFAPHEDLASYPRDLQRDIALLAPRGCDIVFAPSVAEMYPDGFDTSIDVGAVARPLEGKFRPTHFAAVATVVMKLFQLAPADCAFFGQKDYQQTLVVGQMVRDLNVPMEICVCPTVREADGLAMSSRNAYLSADERQRATALYASLQLAAEHFAAGETRVDVLRSAMREHLESVGGIDVQYIAFVAEGTVTPVDEIRGPTVIAIAAKVGRARLIDNLRIG